MPGKVFYDCEFVEDGATVSLLSIGMVASDGREYYAVVDDPATVYRAAQEPWLRENVLSSLPVLATWHHVPWDKRHPGFRHVRDRKLIQQEVASFLVGTGPDFELWADYGAYDHLCLAQLFGRMTEYPAAFPQWTNDLRTLWMLAGRPELPKQSSGLHNALADARHNRVKHDFLMAYITGSRH